MIGWPDLRFAFAAALLLAGCDSDPASKSQAPQAGNAQAPAAEPAVPAAKQGTTAVTLEGDGLRLVAPPSSTGRPILFGAAEADVLRALAFRGAAETGTMEECGAGPIDFAAWPDGFKAHFQDGKFVGWAVDDRSGKPSAGPLTTAAGIGPGSSRAQLDEAYSAQVEETTLGTEFSAGGMFGVLDGDRPESRITVMWAGESCNFR